MPIASIRCPADTDVEHLENRILLSSVISVSPGYQDATQAVQNALNNAGSGGTVNLAPGTYNISSQLTIPSGVTLEGAGKATLNWTSGSMGNLLYSPWYSTGTKVDGVTFNGAGYKIDPQGSNLTISNNTFQNNTFQDAYFGNGLYIPDVESNCTITGNTFTNINGNVGIYIFNAINTQITNNTFSNLGEAIKGQWSNSGSNDSISNNTLTGISRFGIECQGNPVNLTVSGNLLGNWQSRPSHIGLSIATGQGNDINITGNVILGTGISNPNTSYAAIEAMGDNLTISNNFASGWGWAELVGFTDHWVTENNTWGVNTAIWVTEAGGVNPSVDSGNTNVALEAQPSGSFLNAGANAAPAPAQTPAPPPPSPPTAPVSTPAPAQTQTTAPVSTAKPTTPVSTSAPTAATKPKVIIYGPAAPAHTTSTSSSTAAPAPAPAPATFSNDQYSVWGNGLDVSHTGNNSTFSCQTASSGTLTLIVRAGHAKPASGNANVKVMIRSAQFPGAVQLPLKSASKALAAATSVNSEITRRLRAGAGFVYIRLVRTDGAIQGEYSTNGTDFTPLATVKLNP